MPHRRLRKVDLPLPEGPALACGQGERVDQEGEYVPSRPGEADLLHAYNWSCSSGISRYAIG